MTAISETGRARTSARARIRDALTAPGPPGRRTRLRPPSGRRRAVVDPAVAHAHDPVGRGGDLVVVGHHHDRLAALVQPTEQPEHLGAALGVERPGRLIGEQQRRARSPARVRSTGAGAARPTARRGSCAPCRRSRAGRAGPSNAESACLRLRPATTIGSETFSSTLIPSSRLKNWKTSPMWRRRITASSSSECPSIGSPSIAIRPSVGVSSPATRLSRVDLPQPEAP